MSEKTPTRPTQATLACVLVISGSVFLVMSLFGTVGSLSSLETRRSVEDALAEPGLSGTGLGVQDALAILRISALVAGGCAAAMAVLGVYAMRRHRPARVALSVLAVPLFVSGIFSGGFLSSMVAVAVILMWLQPSRDWFAGITRPTREARTAPASPGSSPPPAPDRSQAPSPSTQVPPGEASPAPAYQGFGSAGGTATDTLPRAWGATTASQQQRQPTERGPRPAPVTAASVLTWIFSAATIGLLGFAIYAVLADAETFLAQARLQNPEAFDQEGMTDGLVTTTAAVFLGVLMVFPVGSAVLAWFAFRGAEAARVGLVVASALFGLLMAISSLFGAFLLLVPAAAAGTTLALLLRPDVRAWYAGRAGTTP